ncbi:MAG: cell division protein FtsZ [Flavobacterium sp.]|jgi:cell division protein FtsZ|uniref:cell division protein FtsZ n=1 Tax=Flavobacterium sp. TaxID=239 RepID=UPI001B69475E|nr:cell division protein FtsZ [Flavobacterium sp.]MBP9848491.1 cell division protein FtsZ [Flavobacterium sp.]WRH74362.1 MAG: cell division protein FtsZ [Flavobacterium sp.]
MSEFGNISFDLPKNQSNVIKVIGVGGGGSNAINHMFKQGIKGVDFVVCNTDSQALQNSPVPNKIQLGVSLTEGLGAGANPEVGQQSAIESIAEIEKMLDTNTKMIFITAGMGGGTGTGAAPIIAKLAKERDILTVGIVTIPFQFEGKNRSDQALAGVDRLRKQVDSLIVINNNKLREVYGNLGYKSGYSKVDEVLATAARGIAEVISQHYIQNIDLRDAKTVLANSGTAIMGSAVASGEGKAKKAITSALDSPLLNDNKITGAKQVLLLIVSGVGEENEVSIDEISEINEYIQNEAGYSANIIMGLGEDEKLENSISVTVIATGFNIEQQAEIVNQEPKKIIHSLEDEQKIVHELLNKTVSSLPVIDPIFETPKVEEIKADIINPICDEVEEKVVFTLEEVEEPTFEIHTPVATIDLVPTSDFLKNIDVTFEIVSPNVAPTFEIITPQIREIEVKDPEFVVAKEEINFSFDLFETKAEIKQESTIVFDLTEETRSMEVKDPINVVPVTEVNQSGIIKYSLEDYLEKESELVASKPVDVVAEPLDEELNFTMKKEVEKLESNIQFDAVSPLEMSIEESLKFRAEERKRKMKEFNHKFNNSNSQIDEFEKEPAYKRMGIDITSTPNTNNQSRMSLGIDSNDDVQLRSNNSFLHDNVD